MRRVGRKYQFRHELLALALARDELRVLVDTHNLGALPEPLGTLENEAVDTTVSFSSRQRSDLLTAGLVRMYPVYGQLGVLRYLFLAFGNVDPGAAESFSREFLATHRGSRMEAAIAEALDTKGKHAAAETMWGRALSRSVGAVPGTAVWVRYRWVRREVQFGDVRKARQWLGGEVAKHPKGDAGLWQVLGAEIAGAFGNAQERLEGRLTVEELRKRAPAYVAGRATLECARIYAEEDSSYDAAVTVLRPLLAAPSVGTALITARCAQLELRRGDLDAARSLALDGVRLATWDDDPTHQLEVMATAVLAAQRAPFPVRRMADLTRARWSLRHRPSLRQLFDGYAGPHTELSAQAWTRRARGGSR